jgi:NitT/TauT family transport system permease protein
MEKSRWPYLLPAIALTAAVVLWHFIVTLKSIPPYVLPGPGLVWDTLVSDRELLGASLLVTLKTTALALLISTVLGVLFAVLLASSRVAEYTLFPFAVILQVTPLIAIAPILLIYLEPQTAVLVCACIVAFFPVLSNTVLGLTSVDRNLEDLFALHKAGWLKTLLWLRIPSALPYFLGGLRIAGGLALIGAVAAEIAAGVAGRGSGLAYRIVESGYRLNVPRMFAALLLISLAGIAIFALLNVVQYLALRRWHESALKADR